MARFPPLASGRYDLVAQATGFAPTPSETFALEKDKVTYVEVRLQEGVRCFLRLRSVGEDPIGGESFEVTDSSGRRIPAYWTAEPATEKNEKLVSTLLAPGVYALRVVAKGHAPASATLHAQPGARSEASVFLPVELR
jgi:hypothetical protein